MHGTKYDYNLSTLTNELAYNRYQLNIMLNVLCYFDLQFHEMVNGTHHTVILHVYLKDFKDVNELNLKASPSNSSTMALRKNFKFINFR